MRLLSNQNRNKVAVTALSLFLLMAAHGIIEAARDALFLANLPIWRLPWVYIGIAFFAIIVTILQTRFMRGGRVALQFSIFAGSLITLSFWFFWQALGQIAFYALYIWSGVLVTIVLFRFWDFVSSIFNITQAKQYFSFIGTGGVAGAIAGNAIAAAVVQRYVASDLIVISGILFSLAGFSLFLLEGVKGFKGKSEDLGPKTSRALFKQAYTRKILSIAFLSIVAFTLVDFLFKKSFSEQFKAEDLAFFFAAAYFILNLIALAVQLIVVNISLKRFSVATVVLTTPIIVLLVAGVGLFLPALMMASALKLADGSLRHSMHKTGLEVLLVPLTDKLRTQLKSRIDILAQRGGQTVASLLILLIIYLSLGTLALLLLILGLTILWIYLAFDIKAHYVQIFRDQLDYPTLQASEFPEIDVASLESIIAALSSENDLQIIAAMNLLERQNKSRLIPGLVLYHPSIEIVDEALRIFVQSQRRDILPILERLSASTDENIRARALSARSILDSNTDKMQEILKKESAQLVKSTVMINLLVSEPADSREVRNYFSSLIWKGSTELQLAFIDAIAKRRNQNYNASLTTLAEKPNLKVQVAAAKAMRIVKSTEFIDTFINLLTFDKTRRIAHKALVEYGNVALDRIEQYLNSQSFSLPIRIELPPVLTSFSDGMRVASILLQQLGGDELKQQDGLVRFRIILALERLLVKQPDLKLSKPILDKAIAMTLSRVFRYIDQIRILIEGGLENEQRLTTGHNILLESLVDKKEHSIQRLFRLFGLRYRVENFRKLLAALEGQDEKARAASFEILEYALPRSFNLALKVIFAVQKSKQQLEQITQFYKSYDFNYEELLSYMLGTGSTAIKDLTAYHVAELKLVHFIPEFEWLLEKQSSPDIERGYKILLEVTGK